MNGRLACIPPYDGQPAIVVDCPLALQSIVEQGMRDADDWCDDAHARPLWRHLAYSRALYDPDGARQAFEIGYLNRLQQRLRHLQQQ